MVPGVRNCPRCRSWISLEEISTHRCVYVVDNIVEKLNYVHCIFQELEGQGIALPMGDYNLVYDILEDIRDDFEFERIINLG